MYMSNVIGLFSAQLNNMLYCYWSVLRCRKINRKTNLKTRYVLTLCTCVVITCCYDRQLMISLRGRGKGRRLWG